MSAATTAAASDVPVHADLLNKAGNPPAIVRCDAGVAAMPHAFLMAYPPESAVAYVT